MPRSLQEEFQKEGRGSEVVAVRSSSGRGEGSGGKPFSTTLLSL